METRNTPLGGYLPAFEPRPAVACQPLYVLGDVQFTAACDGHGGRIPRVQYGFGAAKGVVLACAGDGTGNGDSDGPVPYQCR